MKTYSPGAGLLLLVAVGGLLWCSAAALGEDTRGVRAPSAVSKSEKRIAVYDSRAVAYAHFWSEAHQRERNQRVEAAGAAEAACDEATFNKLTQELQEEQRTIHLQVFSTAPVDDLLARMSDHVSALKREIGFSWLVSKWDRESLARLGDAEQVDVTAMLVAYYALPEKRTRALAQLLKHDPLPLPVARAMLEQDRF